MFQSKAQKFKHQRCALNEQISWGRKSRPQQTSTLNQGCGFAVKK